MSFGYSRLMPEEYAHLVEQSPIMVWRARTDTLCDYFNERWLDFTGRTMEQEFGNGWAEGVHPDDLQRCVEHYLDHFNRQATFEMEYRLRRHDGAWRWIFDRGVPLYDGEGAFSGYVGSCIDVTDRVEAQQALAEAKEAQIRTLEGLLPICMFCKKIKLEDGSWEPLEDYVCDHSNASVSHGLCPDCYPTYATRLQQEAGKLMRRD